VKLHTYGVYSRQRALHRPIHTAQDIYQYALPLLASLEAEFKDKGGLKIRLMGLRGTALVERNKKVQRFFGKRVGEAGSVAGTKRKQLDADGWEVWPQEEFEQRCDHQNQIIKLEAHVREGDQEDEGAKDITLEILSLGIPSTENLHDSSQQKCKGKESQLGEPGEQPQEHEQEQWRCPICNQSMAPDDRIFNEHIDWCLSREVIRDVVKGNTSSNSQEAVTSKRLKTVEKKKPAETTSGLFPLFKQKQR